MVKPDQIIKDLTEKNDDYVGDRHCIPQGETTANKGQDTIIRVDENKKDGKPGDGKKKASYTHSFETFWSVYPRKAGKGECYKKYKARLNDGFREEELQTAAENYAATCKADKTEEKYIKHGKTFLSENTPFTDYLKKVSESGRAQDSHYNLSVEDYVIPEGSEDVFS